ncbi:MAG: hypothetical protein HOI95_13840 [Chromatiales bacterium]|jgi:phosphoglycerate dehydrogenase-like enzyme|nr:hypothetical protein [Chromatiales bacterium]
MENITLPKLLIYEPAYERLKTALDGRVTPLVLNGEGKVSRAGEIIEANQALPEMAWANRDLYKDGPVRDFMVGCLKSSDLRWFQSSAAGFEHPVFGKLIGNGVRLTNSNASAVPIAEFVVAQVLSVFHPTEARLAAQREHRWQSLDFRDVHGSTWFVYGMGHVGTAVAERARAFGAHVIGCRRTPVGNEPVSEMLSSEAYLDGVRRADVVVMTASLNQHNKHIVNQAFIEALRESSVFVNIGRGGLVDEPVLLAGLDAGCPQWAILDVFDQEPLPDDSPLWDHPKVRLTAHCAGASLGTGRRGDEIFLENLGRYLNDEPLLLQVNKSETVDT